MLKIPKDIAVLYFPMYPAITPIIIANIMYGSSNKNCKGITRVLISSSALSHTVDSLEEPQTVKV